MNHYTTKDYSNKWVTSTKVMIDNNKQLTIRTSKNNTGVLYSNASVATLEGDFFTHVIYQDFSKTLQKMPVKRVTEQSNIKFHLLIDLEKVVNEAKQFYNIT